MFFCLLQIGFIQNHVNVPNSKELEQNRAHELEQILNKSCKHMIPHMTSFVEYEA